MDGAFTGGQGLGSEARLNFREGITAGVILSGMVLWVLAALGVIDIGLN